MKNTRSSNSGKTQIFKCNCSTKTINAKTPQDILSEGQEILSEYHLMILKSPIHRVKAVIAEVFDVPLRDLDIKTRGEQEVASARMFAMYICFMWKLGSLHKIGREFGGRDHGTVLNACRRVPVLVEVVPAYKIAYFRCLGILASECVAQTPQ